MILNSKDPREVGKRLDVTLDDAGGLSIEIQNAYGPGEWITLDRQQADLLTRYLRHGDEK